MTAWEDINDIANARSIEALWKAHCQRMALFGFDRLIYGFSRWSTETSFGDPADFLLLSNHSEAYLDGFIGQQLYMHSPMTRLMGPEGGAYCWSMIDAMHRSGQLTEQEERVRSFNRAHDVTAGCTIGFMSVSAQMRGVISLCARRGLSQDEVDAIWARNGEQILALNNVTHLRLITLPYTSPHRRLTRRQIEVLRWVADGKTTQDIALLMGLQPTTIEKHLRLARQALQVETTTQAVLKIAYQNHDLGK